MIKALQIKSFKIMIGAGILMIFVLVGCSGSESPEITQELIETDELTPTQPAPTSIAEKPIATDTNLPSETEIGYPAPGLDQGTQESILDQGYPAPEIELSPAGDDSGGYPSPQQAYPPPIKTGLVATNPSTVNLASGDLQLIEFFAFW